MTLLSPNCDRKSKFELIRILQAMGIQVFRAFFLSWLTVVDGIGSFFLSLELLRLLGRRFSSM